VSQHLIDTPVILGQCRKCNAYVFACLVGGYPVVADPKPLDADAVRNALIKGLVVYDQTTQSRKPHVLIHRTIDSPWPSRHTVIADHPCGLHANEVLVNQVKAQARAKTTAGAASAARATHATNATRRHSSGGGQPYSGYLYRRCDKCLQFIGLCTEIVGLKVKQYWEWVQHVQCPDVADWCQRCGRSDLKRDKHGHHWPHGLHADGSGEWCD
jgi:hypothetical protein